MLEETCKPPLKEIDCDDKTNAPIAKKTGSSPLGKYCGDNVFVLLTSSCYYTKEEVEPVRQSMLPILLPIIMLWLCVVAASSDLYPRTRLLLPVVTAWAESEPITVFLLPVVTAFKTLLPKPALFSVVEPAERGVSGPAKVLLPCIPTKPSRWLGESSKILPLASMYCNAET